MSSDEDVSLVKATQVALYFVESCHSAKGSILFIHFKADIRCKAGFQWKFSWQNGANCIKSGSILEGNKNARDIAQAFSVFSNKKFLMSINQDISYGLNSLKGVLQGIA